METESFKIGSIIRERQKRQKAVEEPQVKVEPIEPQEVELDEKAVSVDFSGIDSEPVDIPVINDRYGRISDVIKALELETGLSVIPLEMGHIAPEVLSLARHSIFEFGNARLAMSHDIRYHVIEQFQERISAALSSALPFEEKLNITVTYKGKDYETLALSEDEWTYLMSIFRHYKESLVKTSDNQYFLRVLAERV